MCCWYHYFGTSSLCKMRRGFCLCCYAMYMFKPLDHVGCEIAHHAERRQLVNLLRAACLSQLASCEAFFQTAEKMQARTRPQCSTSLQLPKSRKGKGNANSSCWVQDVRGGAELQNQIHSMASWSQLTPPSGSALPRHQWALSAYSHH